MMSPKVCTLAALFVLCTLTPSSQAHAVFAANITGTLGNASFEGYSHMGMFFYNLTSPTLTNKTITSATLVIGNPADATTPPTTAVTLQGPFPPTSTDVMGPDAAMGGMIPDPPVQGSFIDSDVSPAAVAMFSTNQGGVYDLLQVACKGDLYVVLEGKDKSEMYAPLEYVPSDEGPAKTCEEAAVPYKAPAPAAAPPTGAAVNINKYTTVFTVVVVSVISFLLV